MFVLVVFAALKIDTWDRCVPIYAYNAHANFCRNSALNGFMPAADWCPN